jgi:transcription elongation factor GreA
MSIPMTQEGYAKLKAEVEELESRRPGIKEQIQKARELGDLRENADYHAAREELAMLNAKVADLNGKLAQAQVVESGQGEEGKVAFGSTVKLKRLKDGRVMTRTLVGEGEAELGSGKILTTSPIGKAVLGHEAGDTVTAELPRGETEFEILEVS